MSSQTAQIKGALIDSLIKRYAADNPSMADVIAREVENAMQAKGKVTPAVMKQLQLKIQGIAARSRNKRGGHRGPGAAPGPRRANGLPASQRLQQSGLLNVRAGSGERPSSGQMYAGERSPHGAAASGVGSRGSGRDPFDVPESKRPDSRGSRASGTSQIPKGVRTSARFRQSRRQVMQVEDERETEEVDKLIETVTAGRKSALAESVRQNPTQVIAMIDEQRAKKEAQEEHRREQERRERLRQTLAQQEADKQRMKQWEKEEDVRFAEAQAEAAKQAYEKERLQAEHRARVIAREQEERDHQLQQRKQREQHEHENQRAYEDRLLKTIEKETDYERRREEKRQKAQREKMRQTMKENENKIAMKSKLKEQEKEQDRQLMDQYNMILEKQEAARRKALESVYKRIDALGDASKESAEAAKRRQEEEDAEIRREYEANLQRAKEEAAAEQKRRAERAEQVRKRLDEQVAEKKRFADWEKREEERHAQLALTQARLAAEDEADRREAAARRRRLYQEQLQGQLAEKEIFKRREVNREKRYLADQLMAVGQDPDIMDAVERRLEGLRNKDEWEPEV